jgi:hypothetical protein
MSEPMAITREQCAQHGLAPVSIRIEATNAGLVGRTFGMPHQYLALSGPPGGAIIVQVWDVSGIADVEAAVRAHVAARGLEIVKRDRGAVLGERAGVVFTTGQGMFRVGWFGVIVERGEGNLLVVAGVSARGDAAVGAASVLAHPSIARALATLVVE